MKFFKNVKTLQELKKEYKKLAFQYHPDKGGDLETMKELNTEYEKLSVLLRGKEGKKEQEETEEQRQRREAQAREKAKEFIHIIDQLINLDGLIIEIVGDWVWLTGNTKEHKEIIKNCGFFYASKKRAWYLKPNDYVGRSRKNYTLEDIKNKYGSTTITDNTNKTRRDFKKLA